MNVNNEQLTNSLPSIEMTDGIQWFPSENGKLAATMSIKIKLDHAEYPYVIKLLNINNRDSGEKLLKKKMIEIVQLAIDQGITPFSNKLIKYSTSEKKYFKLNLTKNTSKEINVLDETDNRRKIVKIKSEVPDFYIGNNEEEIHKAIEVIEPQKKSIATIESKLSKVKKPKELNRLSRIPPKTTAVRNKKPISQKKFIDQFVRNFLKPYLTGKITQQNENKNRKPMMNLLLQKLQVPTEKEKEIEEIALDAYIKTAIEYHVFRSKKPIVENSPEFNAIFEAVMKALPKDFPKISSNFLDPEKNLLKNALLNEINKANEKKNSIE